MVSQISIDVRNCEERQLHDVPELSSDNESLRCITERFALKLELFSNAHDGRCDGGPKLETFDPQMALKPLFPEDALCLRERYS